MPKFPLHHVALRVITKIHIGNVEDYIITLLEVIGIIGQEK